MHIARHFTGSEFNTVRWAEAELIYRKVSLVNLETRIDATLSRRGGKGYTATRTGKDDKKSAFRVKGA